MKRLLTLTVMLVVGAVGVRPQPPTQATRQLMQWARMSKTHTRPNEIAWLAWDDALKRIYLNAVWDTFAEVNSIEGSHFVTHKLPGECVSIIQAGTAQWSAVESYATLIQAVDKFYAANPSNVIIPIVQAINYSQMKLAAPLEGDKKYIAQYNAALEQYRVAIFQEALR